MLAAKLDEIERHYRDELAHLESVAQAGPYTAGIAYTIEQGMRVYRDKLQLLEERRDGLLAEHQQIPLQWSTAC